MWSPVIVSEQWWFVAVRNVEYLDTILLLKKGLFVYRALYLKFVSHLGCFNVFCTQIKGEITVYYCKINK